MTDGEWERILAHQSVSDDRCPVVELFSGTVLENVTGAEAASDAARLAAPCRDAGVLESIEVQPQGFGTVLREGGAALAGGRRQRVSWIIRGGLSREFGGSQRG